MSTSPDLELRLVAPRRSVREHLRDIWRYRQLWQQLVRKELHVRYQKSTLGLAWSLANPLFLLAIYSVVFSILNRSFDHFQIWVLSGLLLWNFFGTALATGTQAITANGYLVGKVNFPREVLPLASVGATFVHFLLSGSVLVVVLGVMRFRVDWAYLWLAIPAVLTCMILASALAILFSASNVYARDTTHLLDLSLLAWFWLTPIVYPFQLVTDKLETRGWYEYLHLFNPLTPLVMALQRGIYGRPSSGADGSNPLLPDLSVWWYLRNIGIVAAVSIALLILAIRVFDKAEANFAEVM
jgi:ABC-2 type transport system permease protein